MARLFVSRCIFTLVTLFAIVLLAFLFIRLVPGDPVEVLYGERDLTAEQLQQFRVDMGLDRPLYEQFLAYLGQLLRGDLGTSLTSRQPVWSEFLDLIPATIELSLCALMVGSALGIVLGMIAAVWRNTWLDYGVMGGSVAGASMPSPWWGMMLILLLSVQLGWLPVSGRLSAAYWVEPVTGFMLIDTLLVADYEAFWSSLRHLVLPVLVLATPITANIARMTRSSMLEVLGDDYIRTARAKGVGPVRVIAVHGLRNALIPVVTIMGLQIGALIGGGILVETVFSWPGIGRWMINSINTRDYPVLQGSILLIGIIAMVANLTVDFSYGLLDPRIRRKR